MQIAVHRYRLSDAQLDRALKVRPDPTRERRLILDSTGLETKIVRTADMALLLRGYVLRRMMTAGRLLVCFDDLHDEVRARPILGKPVEHVRIAIGGTDFQRTGAVGRGEYDAACHTAPCQILVEGDYPSHWTRSRALQRRFVESFADTYQMPTTVNHYDTLIDRGAIDGATLFLGAVGLVMNHGASPLEVLRMYADRLREAIERMPEMRQHHPSWVLSRYVEALDDATELIVNALLHEGASP